MKTKYMEQNDEPIMNIEHISKIVGALCTVYVG